MPRDFTLRKRIILGGVILLVVADVALAVYSWQMTSSPQAPQTQFAQQQLLLKLNKRDIDDAQAIRADTPKIQKDCDQFEASLFPASSGYSSVIAELGGIAKKSGIRLEDLTFKPTDIPSRGLREVEIDATVNGDYKSVIGFLNGLQRSSNPYVVDSLTLAAETANQAPANVIKVALHVKTYLRTAA